MKTLERDGLVFHDISHELERKYIYPDGSWYAIPDPQWICVVRKPEGDSHRIMAGENGFYIPPGWIAIEFTARKGDFEFNPNIRSRLAAEEAAAKFLDRFS